jgi:hypothetical protein
MPSSNINNVWGQSTQSIELTVPSGQVCLVKRPDPQRLAELGVLDQVDILTKLVDDKHVKRVKGKSAADLVKTIDSSVVTKNPKIMVGILQTADKVVEAVVLSPVVLRPVLRDAYKQPVLVDGKEIPLPHEERVEGQIYTDMIEFVDRMFIFQHAVGGNPDLATFRDESDAPVDGVADRDKVSHPAE